MNTDKFVHLYNVFVKEMRPVIREGGSVSTCSIVVNTTVTPKQVPENWVGEPHFQKQRIEIIRK